MRRFHARSLAALAIYALAAHGGQPSDPAWFVPWKVLNPGEAPPRAQLIVYWLPASRDDMRHSELLTSRTLTLFSSQCVAMHVVRPDDFERVAKLGANGRAPVVLLLDGEGRELTHIDNEAGALRITTIERIVRDEVRSREDEADKLLDLARTKEKNAAIAMYRRVFDQRCLLPRQARTAQRALRKLGVDTD
jgi:hypothetical protein